MSLTPWQPISSPTLLDLSPWLPVIKDTPLLFSGRIVENDYHIEAPDSVLIHAVLPDGRVMLERQYKHCLRRVILTSPSGGVESGEKPLKAARRELLEETGYEADLWQYMGSFKVDGTRGVCTAHLLRAEELRQVTTPHTSDMEDLELVFMDMDEISASVKKQEIALLPDLAIIAMASSDLFRSLFRMNEP